jgi:hypothetical protein
MKDACKLKTSGSSKSVKESGRLYRFYAFTLAASVSCIGWTTSSFGQVTSPVISPAVPSEAPDNVPPTTEELGIPLGSFRLYPTLDIRAGYDTNVFAQPAGQQTGSAYEAISPSLQVRSDWNNHMLNRRLWCIRLLQQCHGSKLSELRLQYGRQGRHPEGLEFKRKCRFHWHN